MPSTFFGRLLSRQNLSLFSRRALLAGAAGLCTFLRLRRVARAQELVTLKAGGVPEESATPVLWAQRSGGFARIGIAVDLEPQHSGTAIAAGVAGGAYQVGKSSIVPLVTAFAKRIPFQLVAPGGLYSTTARNTALIVAIDSPIRTAHDMNGKTLGVSALADLGTLGIRWWMDKNGGDSSSLKIVELPFAAIKDAIMAGRIDAGGPATPALDEALSSGKVRVIAYPLDAIAPVFMYSAWFSDKTYIDTHRKLIDAFSTAELQAAAYVNGHPAQTVDLLSNFTKIPAEVIAKMNRPQMATVMDPKLIQPVVEVCAHYKVIPKPFDAAEMIAPGLA